MYGNRYSGIILYILQKKLILDWSRIIKLIMCSQIDI